MIYYLDLSGNNIKILEAHVFDELVELTWISLRGNEIEEISHPIFAKNKRLEFIDLSCNKFHTLHPNLLDGLPELEEVEFHGKPLVRRIIDKSKIEKLKQELKPLFNAYLLKYGNSDRIRELELVSIIIAKREWMNES